jgi:hypothetical protein
MNIKLLRKLGKKTNQKTILTDKEKPVSQLPTNKTGLGSKNMKSQDITIIANRRWGSTLSLAKKIDMLDNLQNLDKALISTEQFKHLKSHQLRSALLRQLVQAQLDQNLIDQFDVIPIEGPPVLSSEIDFSEYFDDLTTDEEQPGEWECDHE